MLFKNVVTDATYSLLNDRIMIDKAFNDFFLVGGTALALQIGHRKSIDLDLFTQKDINVEELKKHLIDNYNFELSFESENTLKGFIADVQIDCIKYDYKLLKEFVKNNNIRMLSKEDIIPMKLVAIMQDGKRIKDFIDVAYLSREYTLNNMLDLYKNKYGHDATMPIVKALTYFDNINMSEKINMLVDNYSFDNVKKQLIGISNNPDEIVNYIDN